MQSIQVGRPNCSLHFANLKVLRLNEPYVPHLMVTGSFKTHVVISKPTVQGSLIESTQCGNFRILREINFGHLEAPKTGILAILAARNFKFLGMF